MKAKCILIILFTVFSNQEIIAQSDIESRVDKLFSENGERAIASLFFIESTKRILVESISIDPENMLWDDFENKIHYLETDKLNELKIHLINYLKEREKTESKAITDSIYIWCKFDHDLDIAFQYFDAESVELAEVLYNINETKHLVEKYIKEDGQYWGSLSSYETLELYYELRKYVISLEHTKKFYFVIKYTSTIERLNK